MQPTGYETKTLIGYDARSFSNWWNNWGASWSFSKAGSAAIKSLSCQPCTVFVKGRGASSTTTRPGQHPGTGTSPRSMPGVGVFWDPTAYESFADEHSAIHSVQVAVAPACWRRCFGTQPTPSERDRQEWPCGLSLIVRRVGTRRRGTTSSRQAAYMLCLPNGHSRSDHGRRHSAEYPFSAQPLPRASGLPDRRPFFFNK